MANITITEEDLGRIVLVAMHLGAGENPVTANREYIKDKVERMIHNPLMAWTVLDLTRRGRLREWLAYWDKDGKVFSLEQVF